MISLMKDSGIEWIGEIPSDWEVIKTKYFTYMKGRIGWQGLKAEEFIDEGPYLVTGTDFINGKVNWETAYHISEERYHEAPEIQLQVGDLLVTKDGTVGKLALIDYLPDKASLNSHLLVVRPLKNRYLTSFFYYVLSSIEFENYFKLVSSGSTMDSLSQEKMGDFVFTLPNISEQQIIANFLDEETQKFDDAKNLLQRQIEKLKEYRKSLIWETVTKGLDSSVEMMDSRVEWIENVPTNWEIKRLKDLVRFQTGGTPKESAGVNQEQYGIKWFKPGDFKDSSILLVESENHLEEEVVREKKISIYPPNTVLLVGIASIGKVGISEDRSYSNQQITALLNRGGIESKFLAYVMAAMSDYIKDTALYTVVPIVNNQYLSTLNIPFPNIEYQKKIIEYLDSKNRLINKIIDSKRKQNDVINNYKKTLIYDYVTGKRRVE